MYSHQTSAAIEIFNANNKNPTVRGIQRVFDKLAKSNTYALERPLNKLTLTSLKQIMPYIVFQIFIPSTQNCTIEFTIKDMTNSNRRILFTFSSKELAINMMNARVPCHCFKRNQWLNLCIDLLSCTSLCFSQTQFRMLEAIEISAYCRIRRIFAIKGPIIDQENYVNHAETIPRSFDFPMGVFSTNQLITSESITKATVDSYNIRMVGSRYSNPKTESNIQTWSTTPAARTRPFNSAPLSRGVNPKSMHAISPPNMSPKPDEERKIQFSSPARPGGHIRNVAQLTLAAPKRTTPSQNGIAFKKPVYAREQNSKPTRKPVKPQHQQYTTEDIYSKFQSHNQISINHNDYIAEDNITESLSEDLESPLQNYISGSMAIESKPSAHRPFPMKDNNFFDDGLSKLMNTRPFTPPFLAKESAKTAVKHIGNELEYDEVLQCYWDPNTKEYYQISV